MSVHAFGKPRRIVFDTVPGTPYLLLYGNPLTNAPSFDFAQTHEQALTTAPALPLSDAMRNPAVLPPTHHRSDPHVWVVWIALAAAVVAIGALAIRALRTTS